MILKRVRYLCSNLSLSTRCASLGLADVNTKPSSAKHLDIKGQKFERDDWSNVTQNILAHLDTNLHLQKNHPLSLLRQQIVNHFYTNFVGSSGNPIFSIYDNLNPIVTVKQNFDSLLIPEDHVSRKKSDCYYVNKKYLLRAHTTAHQSELITMGLNNFIVVGDVYRRDEIDSSHYPVFHQADAVRLCTRDEVFRRVPPDPTLALFESRPSARRTESKQACHTLEAVKLMEHELKSTLVALARRLFGGEAEVRWVESQFPFTHPSWEMEVMYAGEWMEVLGCGIMQHGILERAGAHDRIGWAFGLGLERLAMRMFRIPDIRLFWSKDSGFLNQFNESKTDIVYKPISMYPQCTNDISFWLPTDHSYSPNDFYDLVRDVGGDIVEQISLVDEFRQPGVDGKTSHCYRIVYRHMEKTLTQAEVNAVHRRIQDAAAQRLGVSVR